MYAEVDFKEIGKDIEITCGPDEIYIMWRFVKEKWKDKEGSKLILSERLADLWEGWDSGPAPGSYRTSHSWWTPPPRCERGYYAQFYVSSTLQDFTFMIVGEDVDAYLFVNLSDRITA